jgi:transcriptional regulator with XRE-family HTH domain
MDIGKRIKILRVQMGLSQAKLAKLLNVTPTALYNWESNRKKVSATMAMQLLDVAKEYGVIMTLDEFFKGKDE